MVSGRRKKCVKKWRRRTLRVMVRNRDWKRFSYSLPPLPPSESSTMLRNKFLIYLLLPALKSLLLRFLHPSNTTWTYEARTLQPFAVSGVRHASVSVSDTDTTPVLRFIFWTLQVSTCPYPCRVRCPCRCRCFIDVDSVNLDGVTLLKVGSGHGLPGIFALLEGAAAVHFQDFNAEVLRFLTIPNLNANLSRDTQLSSFNSTICDKAEVCFFAGDWSGIDKLLPHVSTDAKNNQGDGYDFILMAETVYSINSLQNLYDLIKKCLQHPDGVVYMAAKKYYFGVGGGTGDFCLW